MTQSGNAQGCQTKCWGLAAAIGLLSMILALTVRDYGWGTSIFLGLLVAVLLGLLLTWLMCSETPKLGQSDRAKAGAGAGAVGGGSAAVAPAAASGAAAAAAVKPAEAKAAPPAASSAGVSTEAAKSAEAAASGTSGQDAGAESKAAASAPSPAAATSEDKPAPGAGQVATATKAGADTGTQGAAAAVKPSAALAGEAELASRKGSWKYEGGTSAATSGATAQGAASGGDAGNTAASKSADLGEDYDGDGVFEGADEGTKPATLEAARPGGADNLKEIKGVGPKLEKMLNEMGFYHFDQIAGWSADEVAWVNANLSGFKGRVSRDNWVEQAKILAEGGETEFSKRVDKGGVY